ncbi:MAG: ribosomal protein S18-alanine N-acetyltransferase [Myxococcales bacterium]|jgi:ribosomal-protein-alanine N-acetyltransferase|nr:ribosomal protein S18-alanine N-acetyltransferase [Myxococcales bacterium]
MTPRLRPASVADLDGIAAVEAASFEAPWSRELFAQELERPIARVLVADDDDDEVLGFACWWSVVDEAHLLRIAVDPRARRAGLGARLLAAVLRDATVGGCARVELEVGRRNVAALRLYIAAGFVEVGVRRGYYQHPPDDAVLLRAELVAPAGGPLAGG